MGDGTKSQHGDLPFTRLGSKRNGRPRKGLDERHSTECYERWAVPFVIGLGARAA
jgi:hypothetical protein